MPRVSLQQAVRETRATLAAAQKRSEWRSVQECIWELRDHADRAEREAGATTKVVVLLRSLANRTEREMQQCLGVSD